MAASTTTSQSLYIIYNADSTMLGKLSYVKRKVTCPDPNESPACAACELTHGPSLSLKESSDWVKTRARIDGVAVQQVHRDEMPIELKTWTRENKVPSPSVVVSVAGEGGFRELLTREDLARVRKNHEDFLQLLETRAGEEKVVNLTIKNP
ncbi:hypothetical protein P152DRAFT_454759 [Eremomyces bilateralis CBS 781.70]|uniref:Uncharacterized protein n=1 Tax=Eremomyces bilateralis CBS 781.70 TaxID=1392243 RepID=A0A6G1GEF6_9PEZI|nr:uncharacterized protein P152DRAFT_454759 [Eremomyces bilateralis CBS 781.70]KAF1816495.1 hypothetical protein P152DRAFT_454759 [Eremomyces bilateralis CBS 781.70]